MLIILLCFPLLVSVVDSQEFSNENHPDTLNFDIVPSKVHPVAKLRYSSEIFARTLHSNCPFDEGSLKDWHDPGIWQGKNVPSQDGSEVTLPSNTKVLLSSSPTHTFSSITIPDSSELILNNNDIEITTNSVVVHGKLRVGSPTCRLSSRIKIILTGKRIVSPPEHYKGIQVFGQLDFHGAHYFPSWTRLAKTVEKGDTTVFLQEAVNWDIGSKIVLIGTALKDARDWHQNEIRTVTKVFKNAIEIDEPAQFVHYGTLDYQGEVGVLSRRITISGDVLTSKPTDTSNHICNDAQFTSYPCPNTYLTGFGGHMICRGVCKVQGVELLRMGQTNVLGRYPFHAHLLGSQGSHTYIKDSSIHESYYRCIVTHGTHNMQVVDNFCFDIIGHAVYLEDGIEENNTFTHNFAGFVHFMEYPRFSDDQMMPDVIEAPSRLTNPADTTASGFYITNAYNRFIGNGCSGGWSCYAFVRLDAPIKLHREYAGLVFPSKRPVLEFDGNSAHSTSFWWHQAGAVYVGGTLSHESETSNLLVYNPGRDLKARETQSCYIGGSSHMYNKCDGFWKITNTKIFLSGWGVSNWGLRGEMEALEIHDTVRPVGILGTHYIANSLFVCRTGVSPDQPRNLNKPNLWPTWLETRWFTEPFIGFEWYDFAQSHILSHLTFRNCGNSDPRAVTWRVLTHSNYFVPGVMQGTIGIKYEGEGQPITKETVNVATLAARLQNSIDMDGSATLRNRPTILGSSRPKAGHWWRLDDTSCTVVPENFYGCDLDNSAKNIFKRPRTLGSLLIDHGPPVEPCDILVDCAGTGTAELIGTDDADAPLQLTPVTRITGATNGFGWYVKLDAGPPKTFSIKQIQLMPKTVLFLVIAYPAGTTFDIKYEASYVCSSASCGRECVHQYIQSTSLKALFEELRDDAFYFDGEYLWLRVTQQREEKLTLNSGTDDYEVFSRDGIDLPVITMYSNIKIQAYNCGGNGQYYCGNVDRPKPARSNVCQRLERKLGVAKAYDAC